MAARANPIDVIETAYQMDGDDRAWLKSLAQAVRPLMDRGLGVMAMNYDLQSPPIQWLESGVSVGAHADMMHAVIEFLTNARDRDVHDMYTIPSELTSTTQGMRTVGLEPASDALWRAFCRAHDVQDSIALRTIEPGNRGIILTALQRREQQVDRRNQRLWARVATHLAAARRLRASLASGADASPEAVLTPAGVLDHAEGAASSRAAREALREATIRCEHARGRERRRDPERATEGWRALVAGRWSLVDHFESGGRRYLVARPNLHQLPDPRALSDREHAVARLAALGKSNKLIAYELGIAPSTVATHLTSAIRKLGATTRVDLIGLFTRLEPPSSGS
jgi:DNA-binding CsgD family transcriptional regulator